MARRRNAQMVDAKSLKEELLQQINEQDTNSVLGELQDEYVEGFQRSRSETSTATVLLDVGEEIRGTLLGYLPAVTKYDEKVQTKIIALVDVGEDEPIKAACIEYTSEQVKAFTKGKEVRGTSFARLSKDERYRKGDKVVIVGVPYSIDGNEGIFAAFKA